MRIGGKFAAHLRFSVKRPFQGWSLTTQDAITRTTARPINGIATAPSVELVLPLILARISIGLSARNRDLHFGRPATREYTSECLTRYSSRIHSKWQSPCPSPRVPCKVKAQ